MLYKILLFVAAYAATALAHGPQQESDNIVRPCILSDYKCIRDNLSANSKCNTQVRGSMPSQYTRNNFRFETPFFNASYIDEYLIIRNHDKCFVSEYFVNKKADSAVLSIDCPLLDLESNRTLLQHRTYLEDLAYSFLIRGEYPLIRLTTQLSHANVMDICTAFTFAEVTALPRFIINPNNKPTANFLSRDLSAVFIYERETFLYRAPSLFRYFVNSYICDFGCNE